GYKPDGIESMILNQTGKNPTPLDPKKDGEALDRLAVVTATIAEILPRYAPAKGEGKKTAAEWNGATDDLRRAAADIRKAVLVKDKQGRTRAFTALNASCNRCHSVFRDD